MKAIDPGFATHTPRAGAGLRRHPAAWFAFALSLSLPAAAAAQTVWTGTVGDWFSAGNWSAGVPNASADARIDNGGTSELGSGSGAVRSIILGFDTTDTGALTAATGSTLDVTADLSVGYGGNGTLAIGGGAVISSYSGEIGYTIASGSGVHGDATVDGAGSAWNNTFELYVGYGTGTLTVTNGASVSDYYGYLGYYPEFPGHSSGTATIDGTGSIWTSGASLHVGDSGTGVVGVTNGGAVVTGEGDLGFNFGSDGTATIDGSGSSWTTNGFFYVGNGGNGTLHVLNGGAVSSLGSYGYIAFDVDSTSSATVDGAGSTWSNSNGLYIGFGGNGSLAITSGGVVENGAFANVGFSPGASGTLAVSGAGSTFATGGALSIGGNVSGAGGTGALQIDDDGAVSASVVNVWNTGAIELGGANIETSTLTVDGGSFDANAGGATIGGDLVFAPTASSTWSVPADGLASVAVTGSATLDGALVVDLDSSLVPGQYTLLEADNGFNGSAFATVSVSPPGPDLTAQVTYDANHVYLVLASTAVADVGAGIVADRAYARAGEIINYTVTLQNISANAASGAAISSALSPLLDVTAAAWVCLGPPDSGCTASGTGDLDDAGLSLPANGSVSYLLSAPVRGDVGDGTIETTVHATLAGDSDPSNDDASAATTVVLFRNGFEPDGGVEANDSDPPHH